MATETNTQPTEYVWNEDRTGLAHLVESITSFDTHGDAATYCGLTTSVADVHARFDICPACTTAWAEENS